MPWYILFALLSAVFASLVAIFGKIGIEGIDSVLATTVRSIIMALFLILVSLSFGKWRFWGQIDRNALFFIFLAGLAGAISWLFYFLALKSGDASVVAVLDRLSVVFVLILAFLFLGESITLFKSLGIILVVVGAVLMIL